MEKRNIIPSIMMRFRLTFLFVVYSCLIYSQGLPKKINLYEKSVFVSGLSGKLNEQEWLRGAGIGAEFLFSIQHIVHSYSKTQGDRFQDKPFLLMYQPSFRFEKDYQISFRNAFLFSLKNKYWKTGPFASYRLDYIDAGISIQNQLEINGIQMIGPQLNFKFPLKKENWRFWQFFFHAGMNYYFPLNQISKSYSGLYGELAIRCRLNKISSGGGF